MAIRIKEIKIDGKRIQNLDQVKVARWIEEWLDNMEGIEGKVEISRYYADRWYSISQVKLKIENDREVSLGKREERKMKDIKEMYQKKAEELAQEMRGKEFEELPVMQQEIIYEMAIVLVGEELQEKAEALGEEIRDE